MPESQNKDRILKLAADLDDDLEKREINNFLKSAFEAQA